MYSSELKMFLEIERHYWGWKWFQYQKVVKYA